MKFLANFEAPAYGIFRAVTGFLFFWHGMRIIFDYPDYNTYGLDLDKIWHYVGGSIALIGGALVMLGVFTRYAAFIASGTMAVTYWMVHAPHTYVPFDFKEFLPIVNKGELPVLFTFAFLYIACKGSGALSIDRIRS